MNIIKLNKTCSKINSIVEKQIKPTNCILCGKTISSCCNSHTIPQFILENLGYDGEYFNAKEFMNTEEEFDKLFIKNIIGKNNALTFRLICRDCDSKYFKEYETPDIFSCEITNKILFKIFYKNLLYNEYIEKHNFYFFKYIKDNFEENIFEIQNLDEMKKEYLSFINERMTYSNIMLKNISLKKQNNIDFEIIYFDLLDYVVPIAFQDIVRIEFDFKNKVINNLHSLDENYLYSFLNICIFPYKNKSLILMFCDKNDKKLENFIVDFKKLSKEEKQKFILYFIFKYNDTFLINKKLKHKTYVKNKIKDIVDLDERDDFDWILRMNNINPELLKNNLNNIPQIPNILNIKYRID